MPPPNDQRPETDYERWLREQNPDFKLGEQPLYDASQSSVLGLVKGRESFIRETLALPPPSQTQNEILHSYFITPPRHHGPGLPLCPRDLVDWLDPQSYFWIVVSGLMIALLAVVIKRAKTASHRDRAVLRAGYRKQDEKGSRNAIVELKSPEIFY
ncbi:hypothetical protein BDV06DRAFT_28782 [Aspergillus oleicola]